MQLLVDVLYLNVIDNDQMLLFKNLISNSNNNFQNVRYHPKPIDSKSVECAMKWCIAQFRNMVPTQVAIILIHQMGDFSAYALR